MITRIEALSYKCLRDIDRQLGPFQVLIGPNASGKSTFLDVVSFLGDLLRLGVSGALERRARTCRELVWKHEGATIELAVELKAPMGLMDSVSNGNGGCDRCRYEVRIGVDGDSEESRILAENFWIFKAAHQRIPEQRQITMFPSEQELRASIVRGPHQKSPISWRKIVFQSKDGQSRFRAETTGWNFPLGSGNSKAALSMVPDDPRFPVSNWAARFLMEGVHALTLTSSAMRLPCRPDVPERFLPDGSNLPRVLMSLRRRSKDKMSRWVKHVKTVLPEIQDIEVMEREEDRFLYLVARMTSGVTVPYWLLSDGTLRFLALTLLAYMPDNRATYLIEEPENGMHPRAVEAVFQSLSSVYEGQVLVATHSPLLLGLAGLEQILCFGQTKSGATDVLAGNEHPRLKDWKGEMDLGTLYASGVLG